MATQVTLKGPLFSAPRRTAALAGLRSRIGEKVSGEAEKDVASILRLRIQHPTPIYQTLIRTDRTDVGRWKVTDQGGVIYNYWLEGIGSRNYPVTRFRGYHAFRLAFEFTDRRARMLAQNEVARTVRMLGGRAGLR